MKKTLLILLLPCFVHAQRITVTVTGTGLAGYSGDGGAGIAANISGPSDVCVDAAQNLYFVDQANGLIRKLSSAVGVVTTVAGGGSSFTDGVPATNASLSPNYICIGASGNLYVSTGNEIRTINLSTGIITTVAGDTAAGYGGDGGPATAAVLNSPEGICFDGYGNLFIADRWNNRIREISASTGNITTIAGTGVSGDVGDGGAATAALLYSPVTITLNGYGDVFFSDQEPDYPLLFDYSIIRKISVTTGIISTIAGEYDTLGDPSGVLANSAELGTITGMNTDNVGNIYCNEMSCSCRQLNFATDSLNTVGGNFYIEGFSDDETSTSDNMNHPMGLCLDNRQNIYVADMDNNRIRKLILATSGPSFALGEGQSINPCIGVSFPVNLQMSVTDLDLGVPETWTVLNEPANGTLSGFPFTKLSLGTDSLVLPTGLSYTPISGFSGADTFKVKVTDGVLADTVAIYVTVSAPTTGVISSSVGRDLCVTSTDIPFSETVLGGVWGVTNGHAIVGSTGSVNPVSLGLDTIIYASDFRCAVTDTYVISIVTLPATGVITGTDSLCIGASGTVSESISGGVWSSASAIASVSPMGVVNGRIAGIDSINYSITNVCGTASAVKVITIDSTDDPGVITGLRNVCERAAITLSDTITWGFWSATNGNATVSSGGAVNGLSPGVDTISYTVTNTCGASTTYATVTINPLPAVGAISGDSIVCLASAITFTDTTSGGIWTADNGNATVSSGGITNGVSLGIDTIAYAVTNHCGTISTTSVISIITLPNISAIEGDSVVCLGASISLTDSAVSGFWTQTNDHGMFGGGGAFFGLSEGSDTIYYTVSNSCGVTSTTDVISVITLPNIDMITGDSIVCLGATISLTDSATGGFWTQTNDHALFYGDGSYFGLSQGLDTVVYSITNSCGSVSNTKAVTVINCNGLGINETNSIADLEIFPNPASSVLNITWASWLPLNNIIVEDIAGREVSKTQIADNGSKTKGIDVSDLVPGVYFLRINTTQVKKFVRE